MKFERKKTLKTIPNKIIAIKRMMTNFERLKNHKG